ncbi:MAG: hypothetical protein DRJ42_24965 [Deltaproteobacteria bacterium]|nr:MAG: hypothetical protein DRJ42_24965 [Deltaproteobacteria bacterium]
MRAQTYLILTAALVVAGCGDDGRTPTPTDTGVAVDTGAGDTGVGDTGVDDANAMDSGTPSDSSTPDSGTAGDTGTSCVGTDSDGDGVCDDVDACEGSDDRLDADGDGTPDGCDCDTVAACDTNATCAEFSTGAVCMCNTGFTGDGLTCAAVDCGGLTDPTDGSVASDGTTFGSTGTYTCDTGFMLIGDSSRTCQDDGTWSGMEPTCAVVDCGALSTPTNASLTVSMTTFGAMATYSCDTGYTLASGDLARTCGSDGSWTGAEPVCGVVDCGGLSAPADGGVSVPSTVYEATAGYTCDTGFMLIGDSSRTCQADGSWSGAAPTCSAGDCAVPPAPTNGSVAAPGRLVGDYATYSCDSGYQLRGATKSRCITGGAWLGATPTCAALLSCAGAACASYADDDPIIANVANPGSTSGVAAGTTGFAVAGNTGAGVELLTEWTGWTGGHDGNCGAADCGSCTASATDNRWYIACSSDFKNMRLTCTTDGEYYVGERVVALADNPNGATGVSQGQLGTVIAGTATRPLIEWDGWTGGHSGNCSAASCYGCTNLTGGAVGRWYTNAGVVGLAP